MFKRQRSSKWTVPRMLPPEFSVSANGIRVPEELDYLKIIVIR